MGSNFVQKFGPFLKNVFVTFPYILNFEIYSQKIKILVLIPWCGTIPRLCNFWFDSNEIDY